ncbi:MAG: hypothetical protein HKN91_03830 [Acidimicrobiia bacterium]|nr:hypothetical protein [Acidimicrobiia bacterium]
MADTAQVIEAITASWSAATSACADQWTKQNRARGQCDVSSFVLWEHAGGDLVLGQVFVDGELVEHHYWNRIDGVDLDLTADQFSGEETIKEMTVVDSATLASNQDQMRQELATRIEILRRAVMARLALPA